MIVVGLGNPGHQYALTRHNLGFRVVESLVTFLGGPAWTTEQGTCWSKLADHWMIKPSESMNVSGQTLRKFFDWRELPIEPSRLIVVHDDVDFPLGVVRHDVNRSSGGHQGVQSIIDALHSQDFLRLRLGIGSNREAGLPAEAYVLQRFTEQEHVAVDKLIDQAVSVLRQQLAV